MQCSSNEGDEYSSGHSINEFLQYHFVEIHHTVLRQNISCVHFTWKSSEGQRCLSALKQGIKPAFGVFIFSLEQPSLRLHSHLPYVLPSSAVPLTNWERTVSDHTGASLLPSTYNQSKTSFSM